MKERVNLTLDSGILKKIDTIRGLIPRATFINEELRKKFAPAASPAKMPADAASNPVKECASA